MIGKHVSMLAPPELAHEEEAVIARLRRGSRVQIFETVRVRKNGTRVPISVSMSPVADSRGVLVGASKIARDITAQKAAEELQRKATESAKKMALIIDSSDDAIMSMDLNGVVQSWNNGACVRVCES